ncbi:MAG TPA: L-seryl-tRNA(Sec) selenium transferase [Thermoanaerobaculia bacterium]
MAKSPARAVDSMTALRAIPSVERILSGDALAALTAEYGRHAVKDAVVGHLATLRASRSGYVEQEAVDAVAHLLAASTHPTLLRVINTSGVIIHTNLGRAPLDAPLWQQAGTVVSGYSNLEFDLVSGERGSRHDHLGNICRTLFGCEAALLTNNNAAGTMLVLAALAAGKEVIVSRGELVEIGGGFRVPEVISQGGAKLREVGTTNRTRARDYAEAISRRTAALLRVHRSNFDLVGFTETPSISELVDVARSRNVPLIYDEGSGRVVDLQRYGFTHESSLADLMVAGVDLVNCSTDKLMGSVQGGLILGRGDLIERCRIHPLMRAVRAGKESYAIVAATLRAFAAGKHETQIPIYRMLATTRAELEKRGTELIQGTGCRLTESRCALGGGTTPAESVESLAIEVPGDPQVAERKFRENDPPIIGRIQNDRYTLELRTLMNDDLPAVREALVSLMSGTA